MTAFFYMSDENTKKAPGVYVVVFAGPNGSGKTSLIDEIKQHGLATYSGTYPLPAYFINPDQVAKEIQGNFPNQDARDEAAQRAAMRLRAEAIASRQPFAFETVMSHPSRISEMLALKQQDYSLFLTFISTDDPERNVERVKLRYETGTTTGHYVAPEKVRERYARTLALLPRAAEIADAVFVYDNSVDFSKPSLQVAIERDVRFSITAGAKEWVLNQLVYPLQQRDRELDQLVAAIEKKGYLVGDTDELHGVYKGPVLFKTTYFLAQAETTSNRAVIHDRLMLDTAQRTGGDAAPAYLERENLTISYSPTAAPSIERHGFSPVPDSGSATKRKSRARTK